MEHHSRQQPRANRNGLAENPQPGQLHLRSGHVGKVLVASLLALNLNILEVRAGSEAEASQRVQDLMQQAHTLYVSGEFSSAWDALRLARQIEPDSPTISLQQALLLDATGRFVEARERYDQVLTESAGTQTLIPSAINHIALSQTARAEAEFKAALRLAARPEERDYIRIWLNMLATREARKVHSPCRRSMLETARYGPLCEAMAGTRDVEDAESYVKGMRFSTEREQRSVYAEYHFFLGSVEQARGENESAERLLRVALANANGSIERPLILHSLRRIRPSVEAGPWRE